MNPILNASNAALTVTNLTAAPLGTQTQEGVPLGTPSASATGELAVKVMGVGGSFPATQTVTPHIALLGASAAQVIPAGAKGYFWAVLTGTATVGGVALIPAGVSNGDSNTLATTLTITTAGASSAFVAWNT